MEELMLSSRTQQHMTQCNTVCVSCSRAQEAERARRGVGGRGSRDHLSVFALLGLSDLGMR